MSFGLVYWVLMLIWFVFGLLIHFEAGLVGAYGFLGNVALLFVLFLLLGWKVFGPPVHP